MFDRGAQTLDDSVMVMSRTFYTYQLSQICEFPLMRKPQAAPPGPDCWLMLVVRVLGRDWVAVYLEFKLGARERRFFLNKIKGLSFEKV